MLHCRIQGLRQPAALPGRWACSHEQPGRCSAESVFAGQSGARHRGQSRHLPARTNAILLRGFDANGPIVIAGSVVFDGQVGNITGWTLDVTRSTGHHQLNVQKNGSSYVVGNLSFSEGAAPGPANVFDYSRGCMTLALADATNGTAAAPASFSFTLGGCTNHFTQNQLTSTSQVGCNFNNGQPLGTYTTGRIIEFDDQTGKGTRATGLMRQQSTSSFSGGLSGPYAFGMSGGNTAKQHYAIAGFFQAASGNLTAVAADFDDGGTLGTQ